MRKLIILLLVAFMSATVMPIQVEAKGKKTVSVRSYSKKDGTKVSKHKRSKPSKK